MTHEQNKKTTAEEQASSPSQPEGRSGGEQNPSASPSAAVPTTPRVAPSAAARGAFYFPPRRRRQGTGEQEMSMPGEQDPKTPEDRENELSDEREGRGTPEREDSAGEYAPEQPDDVLAEQDGEESVERLLTTLVQVSRLTMALLEAGDPNPEELETLAARRAEVFARLQRAVERERQQRKSPVTPEEKARRAAIAGELQQVDGQCVQLGRERLAESKSDWEKARLLRRTLVAYGWNDPEYAPRGYFVDTVD